MKKHTWDDVEAAFRAEGTELYFSPEGPQAPTVAVIRHDIDEGLDVEFEVPISGDEARDVKHFVEAVARETEDTSDERMAGLVGIDPDDAELVDGYHDEIVTARSIYRAWQATTWEFMDD